MVSCNRITSGKSTTQEGGCYAKAGIVNFPRENSHISEGKDYYITIILLWKKHSHCPEAGGGNGWGWVEGTTGGGNSYSLTVSINSV